MNLLASFTILAPTIAVVFLADGYLKTLPRSRQLKLGLFLACVALAPLVGLFVSVPGGAFSDAPPSLSRSLEYLVYLALGPLVGILLVAVMTITRGLWRSTKQPLHGNPPEVRLPPRADIIATRDSGPMTDVLPNPYAGRADSLRAMKPQLIADVRLYAAEDGGRAYPAYPGWGCPCVISNEQPLSGYDGWPILDNPIQPGEERKGVGFVFLSAEGADLMRRAGRFHLWEGKLVGQASVVG